MGIRANQWRETVEPTFGFLIDLGFVDVDVDDSSFWSLWVQYRSPAAAVRVSKSNEFTRVEVELIRLADGRVPAYPIWITDDRIDWTLLDNVIEVRRPDLLPLVRRQHGLTDDAVKSQLTFWAEALRDVAPDFLEGGFGAIDEAGELVRRRVADNPQKMQVWIPSDAPAGAEAQKMRELEGTLPPEVGLEVHRYRRPRSVVDWARRRLLP